MDPEYKNVKKGWPKDVLPGLKISIAQFLKYYRYVKIGITCNPESRFKDHRKPHRKIKWQRMVVKYQTDSIDHANEIEKFFIDYEPRLKNLWPGYSNMTECGPYYVYLLLAGKRKKK